MNQVNSHHINHIPLSRWQPLFDLESEIEQTTSFATMNPIETIGGAIVMDDFFSEVPLARKFSQIVYDLGIVLNYDWQAWEEGRRILESKSPDLNNLDLLTLCKITTSIIRADRFCEGTLVFHLESGLILQIIKAIRIRVTEMQLQK